MNNNAEDKKRAEYLYQQGLFINRLKDIYGMHIDYEYILEKSYRRFLKRGDIIIDVGAHSGRHSQHFVDIVGESGRVIAFEPLDYFWRITSEKLKPYSWFECHNVALSNYNGVSEFTVARGTPEESGLKRKEYIYPERADPEQVQVDVRCLDNYTTNLEGVSYIKIDIEGGEIDCIKGGIDSIKKFRPILSIEYGWNGYSRYGYKKSDIFNISKSIGYSITDIFSIHIPNIDEWESICDHVAYWDFFMVPNEKLKEFCQKLESPFPCDTESTKGV
ncbi:FkbM family methyltransferase [Azospirillum sp. B506]|uniref:FkbM family methyltransferase n=1 Tax=Azospirillum sp. B506 TaxID=137721 RepID=UPI0011DE59B4|nr:FkbM family methyltransferase [Azospirillum sp. B506]